MPGDAWLYAAVAVVLGGHLLALAYLAMARETPPWASAESTGESGGAVGVCACPECGTENDADYRFCRQCVAELPRSAPSPSAPAGRGQPY